MRYPQSVLLAFALAATLAIATLLSPRPGMAQAGAGYKPGPAQPAPEFPTVPVALSAKYPLQPSAALFADNCYFDAFKNDMYFRHERGQVGVRFPKATKSVRLVVDFLIRTDRVLSFNLTSTTLSENDSTTSMVVPKGLQRITVHTKTLTDKDAFARIGCKSDAFWYLVSVNIRRA